VHVMVYRMDDIESDPACKLTRGGMILIGLLSGGDYDQVSDSPRHTGSGLLT
jgi:Holliday junction resolvase YEN1